MIFWGLHDDMNEETQTLLCISFDGRYDVRCLWEIQPNIGDVDGGN